jgi:hypothetical protein
MNGSRKGKHTANRKVDRRMTQRKVTQGKIGRMTGEKTE